MNNTTLVEHSRNGLTEKRFRGACCIIGADGDPIFFTGDQASFFYPRSALKFFQVLPLIESGAAEHFQFSDEELAVMCASHNAEAKHINTVRSILAKAGLAESDLRCGPHMPMNQAAMQDLLSSGEPASAIHNNCSGKHAGFLALAKFMDAPLHSYLALHHPVQVAVRKTISTLFNIPEREMIFGVDGCSAPNYGMKLHHLARGFMRFGDISLPGQNRKALDRVITCLQKAPFLLAGSQRFCTDLVEHLGEQIIGKVGAAGVYAFSFHQAQVGVAVKMEDGNSTEAYAVAQHIIARSGIFTNAQLKPLEKYRNSPILNCNKVEVGYRRTVNDFIKNDWLPDALDRDWLFQADGIKA